MNWIESISKAVDYIENNLSSELKIEDVAGRVHFSATYFQKAFSLLCGFTVGEYIRNRRLANAGIELLTTKEAVMDIAMKYGYESHDSFTKAFTRFHGATPTAVRKNGATIRAYAPLKINLLLKGGFIMDYRIEKIEAFTVFAKIEKDSGKITFIDDRSLPKLAEFQIGDYFSDIIPKGSLYRVDNGELENNAGFEEYVIPECMYAVFKCKGEARNEARENTWLQIKNEWLPQTNYEMGHNYIHIRYNSGKATDLGEIWVVIKAKNV